MAEVQLCTAGSSEISPLVLPDHIQTTYGPTQLPGEPSNIVALGGAKAEMTTSSGAIYYTKNAGMNWSAQVRGCPLLGFSPLTVPIALISVPGVLPLNRKKMLSF